jgi:hypothetical protein
VGRTRVFVDMDIKWRNEAKFMNQEIGKTKRKSTKKRKKRTETVKNF